MLTQSFADAIAEAERIITCAPHIRGDADLAEGYEYLAGHIRGSLQIAWRRRQAADDRTAPE